MFVFFVFSLPDAILQILFTEQDLQVHSQIVR